MTRFNRGAVGGFIAIVLAVPLALAAPIRADASPGLAASPAVGQAAVSQAAANTFFPTAPMSVRRDGATATLLGDGEVLVAGGGSASAELYDPASGTWAATAPMSTPRTDATATLLANGDVLVAGGFAASHPYTGLKSAELYDPSTGTWSPTGSLNVGRQGASATLLQNGDVLVAGGACNGEAYGCNGGSYLVNLSSAELYDPATGTWTLTGSMSAGREYQTATLLGDGEVLVTGGFNSCDDDFCTDLASAELYDPTTGKWLAAAPMNVPREQQTATLLSDGDVLVAGGLNAAGGDSLSSAYASAEIYRPTSGQWTAVAPMNQRRFGQTATLLQSGWVLVTGGGSATSEVYEPNAGVWVPTGDMSTTRSDQTATLLPDGDVLVVGGTGPDQEPLSTAEVYQAGAGPLVALSVKSLSFPTQEVDTTGKALTFTITNYGTAPLDVAGVDTSGVDPSDFRAASACSQPVAPGGRCSAEIRFSPLSPGLRTATVAVADNAPLDPQGVAVSGYSAGPYVWAPAASMLDPRRSFSVTTLTNGEILVAGGEKDIFDDTVNTAELYDPASRSFGPTGSLSTSREFQAAVRLPDGSVLVAGGLSGENYNDTVLSSAEIYKPSTRTWAPTTSMLAAGEGLTANLLDNGLVLVTGFSSSDPELYDPVTATWSDAAAAPFTGGQAVVLRTGTLLLAGGPDGASALYNPAANTWSSTGSMVTPQFGATATLLADGKVLVAGGFDSNGNALSTAQLYDPTTGTWAITDPLPAPLQGQSALLLANGSVLVAGGCSTSSCEGTTYVYANGFWSDTDALPASRYGQELTLLPDGNVLLLGGTEGESANATTDTDVYVLPLIGATPASGTPGQRITVAANGFYGHEVVVVRLGSTILTESRADALGQFRTRVAVPALAAGTYTLSAQGQTSYVNAYSNFVVTNSAASRD